MELGHAVIDREHRDLVERVNRLADLLFDAAAEDDEAPHLHKQQIVDVVVALGEAAAAHFVSEEAIMQAVGYPGLPEHRAQHASLLLQYGDFAGHFRASQSSSIALALRFLREWFEYHVELYDAPLVGWISEQRGGRR